MTMIPGDQVEFVDLPGRSPGDPLRTLDAGSSVCIVRVNRSRHRLALPHPQLVENLEETDIDVMTVATDE